MKRASHAEAVYSSALPPRLPETHLHTSLLRPLQETMAPVKVQVLPQGWSASKRTAAARALLGIHNKHTPSLRLYAFCMKADRLLQAAAVDSSSSVFADLVLLLLALDCSPLSNPVRLLIILLVISCAAVAFVLTTCRLDPPPPRFAVRGSGHD